MDDLKIVAISGSNNNNSFTESLLYKQLDRISYIHNSLDYEVLSLGNYKLQICNGCELCFKDGRCKLDDLDDFITIKKKL